MASKLSKKFPWSEVLNELYDLLTTKDQFTKDYYDQSVVQRVTTRVVRMWGYVTSLNERKKTLKDLKTWRNPKQASYATQQSTNNNVEQVVGI